MPNSYVDIIYGNPDKLKLMGKSTPKAHTSRRETHEQFENGFVHTSMNSPCREGVYVVYYALGAQFRHVYPVIRKVKVPITGYGNGESNIGLIGEPFDKKEQALIIKNMESSLFLEHYSGRIYPSPIGVKIKWRNKLVAPPLVSLIQVILRDYWFPFTRKEEITNEELVQILLEGESWSSEMEELPMQVIGMAFYTWLLPRIGGFLPTRNWDTFGEFNGAGSYGISLVPRWLRQWKTFYLTHKKLVSPLVKSASDWSNMAEIIESLDYSGAIPDKFEE